MFDIIDPFTYTTTLRLLQTQFRASAIAQMEVLRRAKSYKARYYTSPDTLVEPVKAYGQVETQVRMIAGTYIWGLSIYRSVPAGRIQITDASTEIALFSDYVHASLFTQAAGQRAPTLLGQPRLISEPGQVNVEIYNDTASDITVQVVLYCAEPIPVNPDIAEGNHCVPYERLS